MKEQYNIPIIKDLAVFNKWYTENGHNCMGVHWVVGVVIIYNIIRVYIGTSNTCNDEHIT